MAVPSVTSLRGVGDALAARLSALGVASTQDLLFLLPLRYEDRTQVVPLGELRPGQRASVEAEVLLTEVAFRGRRQMLCKIGDGSGFLTLRFFYFTAQQQQGLARGARIRCFGEARKGPKGLEFVHPEYRRIDPNAPAEAEEHLTPIYPSTEGVTQGRLRQLVESGVGSDRGQRSARLAAGRVAGGRAVAEPARGAALCAPPAGRCTGGSTHELAASGAAPPGLRGIAGASAVVEAAAPADSKRSGLGADVERRAQAEFTGERCPLK